MVGGFGKFCFILIYINICNFVICTILVILGYFRVY